MPTDYDKGYDDGYREMKGKFNAFDFWGFGAVSLFIGLVGGLGVGFLMWGLK